jgi:hypothetical protein
MENKSQPLLYLESQKSIAKNHFNRLKDSSKGLATENMSIRQNLQIIYHKRPITKRGNHYLSKPFEEYIKIVQTQRVSFRFSI